MIIYKDIKSQIYSKQDEEMIIKDNIKSILNRNN